MSNQGIHAEHNTKPRRRVMMTLKLGADSRDDMIRALEQMAFEMRQGYLLGETTSGGYSSGYSLKVTEDSTITHDSYMEEISPIE